MLGYYEEPKTTSETIYDGWVRTGDVAIIDEEGYLCIKGRIKDVIIRGGENISPTDIEEKLIKHPSIDTVIIVGVPDKRLGEEIYAYVIPVKGESLSKEEIFEFLSGKIAKYKFPKYIEFTDSFPLTSTGKIKRNILKEMAVKKVQDTVGLEVAAAN